MCVVTLLSDWRNGDYYIGAVKGRILSRSKDIPIIDITHQIEPFNTGQAAFVLRGCYRYFPQKSVHVIGVSCSDLPDTRYVAVKANDHYFVGTDNGIISLVTDEHEVQEMVHLPVEACSFPETQIFADVAAALIMGHELSRIGEPITSLRRQMALLPTLDADAISGSILFVDSYGNVITNITQPMFERVGKGRGFEILIQSNKYRINRLSTHYSRVPRGELVALFNDAGLLEVAINFGNVSTLLSLEVKSAVRIRFSQTPASGGGSLF